MSFRDISKMAAKASADEGGQIENQKNAYFLVMGSLTGGGDSCKDLALDLLKLDFLPQSKS